MNAQEIDKTFLEAKRFLNIFSPPKKPSTGEILAKAKARQQGLQEWFEEDMGSEITVDEHGRPCKCPVGMYIDRFGNPMQKGLWKNPK